MSKLKLRLHSRDKTKSFIEPIKMKCVFTTEFSIRVIFSDEAMTEIQAIDPSGGPMISVGSKIEETGLTVTAIYYDDKKRLIIEMEK